MLRPIEVVVLFVLVVLVVMIVGFIRVTGEERAMVGPIE